MYSAAKEFWIEADIIKISKILKDDKPFRWEEDLGFSHSHLSRTFLLYKEKVETEVSLCIYLPQKQFYTRIRSKI